MAGIKSFRKWLFALAGVAGLALFPGVSPAGAAETRITWHGHATFEIQVPSGHVFMIDPWLNNPVNPNAGEGKDPVAALGRVDYLLVTHGHFDHVADAVAVAKRTGARLVANFELGQNMAKVLGFPADQMGFDTLMNPGGEISLADGTVTVWMVPAVHSAGLNNPKAGPDAPDHVYGGNPVGFVLKIKDGPTIYHTGDTAYFKDMKVIGACGGVDLALVNTGGHFGMEPKMAAYAAKAVRAKYAVAHHWGTFPVLAQDTVEFEKALKDRPWYSLRSTPEFVPMKPGGTIVFEGDELAR